MERLMMVTPKGMASPKCLGDMDCNAYCAGNQSCDQCSVQKVFDKLLEYEDAEDNGMLMCVPCRIGDPVYLVIMVDGQWEVEKHVVKGFADDGVFTTEAVFGSGSADEFIKWLYDATADYAVFFDRKEALDYCVSLNLEIIKGDKA